MSYYPPYKSSSSNIKVELDLSNYATKNDLKNITHTDVSSFASKTNLSALKTEVDKIDIDKLKTVPDDLVKLSNVVKNEVVKKIDFSADNYVTRTKFSTDTNSLDDKIDKVDKKIPDVSGLATKSSVTILIKNSDDRIDKLKINDYYLDKMYIWESTGVNNYSRDSDMDAVSVATTSLPPLIDNGRMSVRLEGAYFKQMRLLRPNNDNILNIFIVYLIVPICNSRNTDYTVQYALLGGVKITKNATDTSKYKCEGYGICFDEGGMSSMGNINDGRNVLIFGVHESSLVHQNDKENSIFIMGNGFVQGINDTTLYAEKLYNQNFTAVNKKFV